MNIERAKHSYREKALIRQHHRFTVIVSAFKKMECMWAQVMKDREKSFYLNPLLSRGCVSCLMLCNNLVSPPRTS